MHAIERMQVRRQLDRINSWCAALLTAFFLGLFGGAASHAGGVPPLPNTAPFNEPSQLLTTLQQFIQQLNGISAYAPASNIGIGAYCVVTGVTPGTPVTCNAQRGTISSSTLTTAAVSNQSLLINNTLVSAQSACIASLTNYTGTFGTAGIPISYAPVVTAGQLQLFIGNVHATNALNGVATLVFSCVN